MITFLFFQVKHAKAHAQMLRQTISAIKTEVWDPSSFGTVRLLRSIFWPCRLCISNADQDFVGRQIFQVIRSSAIWLLSVCEELFWCNQYQWAFPLPIWQWVKRDYNEVIWSEIEVWCDCKVNTWYCRPCVFIKIKLQSAVRNSSYFIAKPREFSWANSEWWFAGTDRALVTHVRYHWNTPYNQIADIR